MPRGRTIARNSLYLTLAHGASKVFSVALTAIAGRVLGPAGYGFYATGSALVEVGRVIASSGLDYLVAREVVSKPDDSSRVASNASTLKILFGALTYLLLLAVVTWLDYPRPVLTVVLILGSSLFFENLSDIVDAVFQGHERMQYTTVAFAVSSAVLFAGGAWALWTGYGLVGYCVAFAVGFAVRWLVVLVLGARRGLVRLRPGLVRGDELRRLARSGAPLLGATVVSLLFHRVDLLMLGKMVAESDVGLYGASVRIIDVVVLMPRILATAVYPSLRRARDAGDPRETARFLAESSRLSLVICSALGIGIWILSPWILRWIPGEQFVPATASLRLLSLGVVLQTATHLFARMLFADERERDFLWIGGISLAANVGLNAWWIPRLGIEGAALSTVVAYGVNAALYFGFVRRRGTPVPLGRALLRPVAAVGLAAVAGYALLGRGSGLAAVGFVGVWVSGLLVLRVLRRSDLGRFRELARGSWPQR